MVKKRTITIFLLLLFVVFAGVLFFFLTTRGFVAVKKEGGRRFGATYMTMNNPFYEIIDDEIRSVLESRGDILITRDPALSVDKQIDQIQEFIDAKVEAIFINPVDWKAVGPVLSQAVEKGIPIIAVDSDIYDKDKVACTVVSDNYQAGVLCAQNLMSQMDGGNIILLTHKEAKSGLDRIRGFRDTVATRDGFEILAEGECLGQLERAMPVTEALLKEYPQTNVVMCLNDPAAMGAMAALEDAGMTGKVAVYGVDGSPDGKSMIEEGIMTATAAQFPRRLGREAAEAVYRILNGETIEPVIKIPTELITFSNLKNYGSNGWQ
jgi:ribose transport system substrate-binding protein